MSVDSSEWMDVMDVHWIREELRRLGILTRFHRTLMRTRMRAAAIKCAAVRSSANMKRDAIYMVGLASLRTSLGAMVSLWRYRGVVLAVTRG
jgi:hypothetical protein